MRKGSGFAHRASDETGAHLHAGEVSRELSVNKRVPGRTRSLLENLNRPNEERAKLEKC